MILIEHPPKMVYNEQGHLIEVILSAKDFRAYLDSLRKETEWDSLPKHLQDEIDLMLIDEVRGENSSARD